METHEPLTRRTLSVREAASVLGVSAAHAYRAARCGELPVVRIGGRILVLRAAFERLLGESGEGSEVPRDGA